MSDFPDWPTSWPGHSPYPAAAPPPPPPSPPKRDRVHWLFAAGIVAAITAVVGSVLAFWNGSGLNSGSGGGAVGLPTVPVSTASQPPAAGGTDRGPLGGSFTLSWAMGALTGELRVSLQKVIDPAHGSQFFKPMPGDRFVGLRFVVEELTGSTLFDDIDLDVRAIGTNGQTYQPVFVTIVGCNNFDGGLVVLSGHQSASSCAVVQMPRVTQVSEVVFTPGGGLAGAGSAEWKVKSH